VSALEQGAFSSYDTQMPAGTSVPISSRVNAFSYAIRNIVDEAKKVEAAGRRVRYLNIGDPIQFGFKTPAHLVEAVDRAIRDGHNGYVPSAGIPEAREAVAGEYTARGVRVGADRVVLTSGTSEGIELVLSSLVDTDEEVLVPTPTYPLYTAVLAKIGARAVYYRTDPARGWQPDLDHVASLLSSSTRAIVLIDPNNPTGAVYPESTRRALIELAEKAGVPILADEVYSDVAFAGPTPLLGSLAPDAPIISFSSLSKAYLAPGWRTGWVVVGATDRLDDVLAAVRKMADGRLCSPGPMQYAVAPALTGDRSHQRAFSDALRVRAEITARRISGIPGMRCVMPQAAFYAMPQVDLPPGRTDEDYVLGLLRTTGNLCVYGSGFGMPSDQGFFRIVYLAAPDVLNAIYDDMTEFTRDFLDNTRG
jgi:alanine-synthesizing transaminase